MASIVETVSLQRPTHWTYLHCTERSTGSGRVPEGQETTPPDLLQGSEDPSQA